MSDRPMTVEDVLDPAPGEKEPGYDEWLRERLRRAVADADARPEAGMTTSEARAHLAGRFKRPA